MLKVRTLKKHHLEFNDTSVANPLQMLKKENKVNKMQNIVVCNRETSTETIF